MALQLHFCCQIQIEWETWKLFSKIDITFFCCRFRHVICIFNEYYLYSLADMAKKILVLLAVLYIGMVAAEITPKNDS